MADLALRRRCYAVAEKLRAYASAENIDEYAPKVIEALEGDSAIFWELDEKHGSYGGLEPGSYAGCLRRVRNHPVWGKRMIASFTK